MRTNQIAKLFICLSLVSACSRKATCETTTDHVMALQASERRDHGQPPIDAASAERRRKRSIDQCQARELSTKVLECILSAKNRDEVTSCDPKRR